MIEMKDLAQKGVILRDGNPASHGMSSQSLAQSKNRLSQTLSQSKERSAIGSTKIASRRAKNALLSVATLLSVARTPACLTPLTPLC